MLCCCRAQKDQDKDEKLDEQAGLGSSYALSQLSSSSVSKKWEEEKRTGVKLLPAVQSMVERICEEGAILDQQWDYVQANDGNIPMEVLLEVDEASVKTIYILCPFSLSHLPLECTRSVNSSSQKKRQ